MKNQKSDFSVLKEEIAQNNVLSMAELITIMEVRFQIGYVGSRMQKMYADLYADLKNKNKLGYVLSNSYDLVQEAALFLCNYYGKHLSDVIGYTKKGKSITIEIACIKKIMKIINRKTSDCYRTVELDALTPASEPRCEIMEEIEQDYTEYENVVKSLNLTENMRVALECRIKGLSYPEIGKILSRAQSTVFEYFIKMRQRYMAIYG